MSAIEPHRFLTVPRPRLTKFGLEIHKYGGKTKYVKAVGQIEDIRIPLEFGVRVWRRGVKGGAGSDLRPGVTSLFTTSQGHLPEWGKIDHWLFPEAELPKDWEKWQDEEIVGILYCVSIDIESTFASAIDRDEAAFPMLEDGILSTPLQPYK